MPEMAASVWSSPVNSVSAAVARRFCLVLVKPSHYDDDGYVIQWLRSPIPSNSLASLYGIAKDCAERRVLGADVEIDIHDFDETNTRVRPDRLSVMIRAADSGMVMLVGVQSNQFPRALDLARPLRARGILVCIGGFHVSGVLSMLSGVDPCQRVPFGVATRRAVSSDAICRDDMPAPFNSASSGASLRARSTASAR